MIYAAIVLWVVVAMALLLYAPIGALFFFLISALLAIRFISLVC